MRRAACSSSAWFVHEHNRPHRGSIIFRRMAPGLRPGLIFCPRTEDHSPLEGHRSAVPVPLWPGSVEHKGIGDVVVAEGAREGEGRSAVVVLPIEVGLLGKEKLDELFMIVFDGNIE